MLLGIPRVSFVVRDIRQWGWFYIEKLGGTFVERVEDVYAQYSFCGMARWVIQFEGVDVELCQGIDKLNQSPVHSYLERHGDSMVGEVIFAVEDLAELRAQLGNAQVFLQNGLLLRDGLWMRFTDQKRVIQPGRPGMIKRLDHFTLVTKHLELWVWFFSTLLGGKLEKLGDVARKDSQSSMILWTVAFPGFGIALVAGIDRGEESQVTSFFRRHGEGSIQHVAWEVGDLQAFVDYGKRAGINFLMERTFITQDDGRGFAEQIFGCPYDREFPFVERSFAEFVHRLPREGSKARPTFSKKFGRDAYRAIENACASNDPRMLIDFSPMPHDWDPGQPIQEK